MNFFCTQVSWLSNCHKVPKCFLVFAHYSSTWKAPFGVQHEIFGSTVNTAASPLNKWQRKDSALTLRVTSTPHLKCTCTWLCFPSNLLHGISSTDSNTGQWRISQKVWEQVINTFRGWRVDMVAEVLALHAWGLKLKSPTLMYTLGIVPHYRVETGASRKLTDPQ